MKVTSNFILKFNFIKIILYIIILCFYTFWLDYLKFLLIQKVKSIKLFILLYSFINPLLFKKITIKINLICIFSHTRLCSRSLVIHFRGSTYTAPIRRFEELLLLAVLMSCCIELTIILISYYGISIIISRRIINQDGFHFSIQFLLPPASFVIK